MSNQKKIADLKKLALMGLAGGALLSSQVFAGQATLSSGVNVDRDILLAACGGGGCGGSGDPAKARNKASNRASRDLADDDSLKSDPTKPDAMKPAGTGGTYNNLPKSKSSSSTWDTDKTDKNVPSTQGKTNPSPYADRGQMYRSNSAAPNANQAVQDEDMDDDEDVNTPAPRGAANQQRWQQRIDNNANRRAAADQRPISRSNKSVYMEREDSETLTPAPRGARNQDNWDQMQMSRSRRDMDMDYDSRNQDAGDYEPRYERFKASFPQPSDGSCQPPGQQDNYGSRMRRDNDNMGNYQGNPNMDYRSNNPNAIARDRNRGSIPQPNESNYSAPNPSGQPSDARYQR